IVDVKQSGIDFTRPQPAPTRPAASSASANDAQRIAALEQLKTQLAQLRLLAEHEHAVSPNANSAEQQRIQAQIRAAEEALIKAMADLDAALPGRTELSDVPRMGAGQVRFYKTLVSPTPLVVRSIEEPLFVLETQLAEKRQHLGPNHPEIKSL